MRMIKKIIEVLGEALIILGKAGLIALGVSALWVANKTVTIGLFIFTCILVSIKAFKKKDEEHQDGA